MAPVTYRIALPQFEGPFDLLLFFIERDEIDICNLPIARITDDFLSYIRHAKALDISLAGDFIVMAATLMSIKAKMLLPRIIHDEQGQEIDPRQELVDRLLDYRRYKAVLEEMRALEEARAQQFGRPFVADQFSAIVGEAMVEAEWESITLFKLLKTFERVLERHKSQGAKPVHRVVRWPFTVEQESQRIEDALRFRGRVGFMVLFGPCVNRVHAIVTFLALLELLNAGKVEIAQGSDEPNDLTITVAEAREAQSHDSDSAPDSDEAWEDSEEESLNSEDVEPVEKVLAQRGLQVG